MAYGRQSFVILEKVHIGYAELHVENTSALDVDGVRTACYADSERTSQHSTFTSTSIDWEHEMLSTMRIRLKITQNISEQKAKQT